MHGAKHFDRCKSKDVLRKQLAIFHETDPELAAGVGKNIGITDYPKGIEGMFFNGVGNGPNGYDPKKINKFGYT